MTCLEDSLISGPLTITAIATATVTQPRALHHSLVLGNNTSLTGSVLPHHFWEEDCRVAIVGRWTQNYVYGFDSESVHLWIANEGDGAILQGESIDQMRLAEHLQR